MSEKKKKKKKKKSTNAPRGGKEVEKPERDVSVEERLGALVLHRRVTAEASLEP